MRVVLLLITMVITSFLPVSVSAGTGLAATYCETFQLEEPHRAFLTLFNDNNGADPDGFDCNNDLNYGDGVNSNFAINNKLDKFVVIGDECKRDIQFWDYPPVQIYPGYYEWHGEYRQFTVAHDGRYVFEFGDAWRERISAHRQINARECIA